MTLLLLSLLKRTGHCYTDRAPNRINGRVMVASASSAAGVRDWSVHARKTDDPAGQVADAALHARLAKLTGRAHIFDVRQFGAKGDGATKDTAVRVCPSPKSSKSR